MTTVLLILVAMFLHELGHASAALVFGVKVYRIGFRWKGAFCEMDLPRDRFVFGFVSAAGCITNFAFMLLGCVEHWYTFSTINLSLMLCLLPLPGWDGWNICQALGLVYGYRVRVRLAEVAR